MVHCLKLLQSQVSKNWKKINIKHENIDKNRRPINFLRAPISLATIFTGVFILGLNERGVSINGNNEDYIRRISRFN